MKKKHWFGVGMALLVFVTSCAGTQAVPRQELSPPGAGTAEDYCSRGDEYFFSGDYERAIANYTRAIEIGSDDAKFYAMIYAMRGMAYLYKDSNDTNEDILNIYRATADMEKALTIDPDNPIARSALER
jgi:tetratricopeptide (TPR) repeat protein